MENCTQVRALNLMSKTRDGPDISLKTSDLLILVSSKINETGSGD